MALQDNYYQGLIYMPRDKKALSAEEVNAAVEEALTRLERAILSRQQKGGTSRGEQIVYIEQLESEKKQLAVSLEEMKKHCIALKNSYDALEEKCRRLENANDSASKELAATLDDLDNLIAQKSLH